MNVAELSVSIPKDDLLERLRDNRVSHIALFQKAMAGYVNLTVAELEQKLADVKAGKDIDRYLINVAPASHEADYDSAIEMLEMCSDSEIVLTQGQFRQFVKDDWGWKQAWVATSETYAANA